MHILFVTSEVAGIFKIGGLADVSSALPVALAKEGIQVTVVLPFYSTIDSDHVKEIGKISVDYNQSRCSVVICEKTISEGAKLLLLKHPKLEAYAGKPIEDTFAFYSKAVASLYDASGRFFENPIDIVHCHDWHTALIPLLIKENNKLHGALESVNSKNIGTIITIHNLMYQGVTDAGIIDRLYVPRDVFQIRSTSRGEVVSFLREGFEYADLVTTVSPTYAKEIVATYHHDALGESLIRRKEGLHGIVNGIDQVAWDPKHDTYIDQMYDASSVTDVKKKLKKSIQTEYHIPTEDAMVIGFVGRIEPRQKGIDLVMKSFCRLVNDTNIQLVILGTGDESTVTELQNLSAEFSQRISFKNIFDDKIAHKIYAGCDALLVPSKFEPCGLTQMIAMRYGTLPIVRKTGGLADTVTHLENGFVFDEYSAEALEETIRLSYRMYLEQASQWQSMIHNAMRKDFSWKTSALEYIQLYRSLTHSK